MALRRVTFLKSKNMNWVQTEFENVQIVQVGDLKEGDEIIAPSNGSFRYYRVLRAPKKGKRKHWIKGDLLYGSVKCSTKIEIIEHPRPGGYIYKEKKYHITGEDHNTEGYISLNYKDLLLVKRKN